MNRGPTTYGETIRAARLGYHWCEQIGAWLRTSDVDQELNRIDVAPVGTLPSALPAEQRLHRCWWEGDVAALFARSSLLRTLAAAPPTERQVFIVDGNGDPVGGTP